jgi:hypothetical protein
MLVMRRPKLPDDVLQYFRDHGARGGTIAGKKMTPAQRKARAVKASKAAAVARTKKKNAKKAKE